MANATIIYACTAGGLGVANKPGTLGEWLPARMVLKGQAVTSAWAEPGPPIRVLAAADGTLMLSENGGRTWDAVDLPISGPVERLFSVGDPPLLYAANSEGGLVVSHDSGASWHLFPPLPAGKPTLLVSGKSDPGRFYYIGNNGTLFTGDPAGGEWQPLPLSGTLALSEEPSTGALYALTQDGVLASADRGSTWDPLPGSPGGLALLAISGPAGKPPALVVGTRDGLHHSQDGDASWQSADLSTGSPVTALAQDPERRDRIYAATADGLLFESGNRGQTWQPINSQPLAEVTSLFVMRI